MSEHLPNSSPGSIEQASENRGPACSPCVSLPARRSPSESRPSQEQGGETERGLMGGQPARREPEGSSPEDEVGIHPRFVLPGIENQNRPDQVPEPGMWCRPDWIRLVGPDSQGDWLMRRLRNLFGECIPHQGAMYFRAGALWHPGVLMSWGHKSDVIMIDLQGSRLACTPVTEFMKLTSEIQMHGFRCTRIDLAVDHVSMDLKLYDNALASCEAGQLCKLRSYSPDPEYKVDGTPMRLLLKLGKRESSVCARIYDKGLETKTLPAGCWERFEVEFKDDRANEVCLALGQAGESFDDKLWCYVIGALDFRVVNGRTELARRPQVGWWARYIGQSKPIRCKPHPKPSSFESWWGWARSSFAARFLQFSEIMEVSPGVLMESLIRDLEPAKTESSATIDLRAQLGKRTDNTKWC